VNDSVAVWRALTLWNGSSIYRLGSFLHFLVFSNLALYLASVSIAYVDLDNPVTENSSTVALLQLTGSAFGTLANVLATSLFAYMGRQHDVRVSKGDVRLRTRKRLILLTESGLLYAVLQIVKLVLAAIPDSSTPLDSPLITANVVWQLGGFVLGAMYTPAVVLIVAYKRSMAHIINVSAQLDGEESNGNSLGIEEIKSQQRAPIWGPLLRRGSERDPEKVYAGA
jgi:hypothetical protein